MSGEQLSPSLAGCDGVLDAAVVAARVDALARELRAHDGEVVALLADNGPDWLLADRTVRMAGRVLLPLPTFFTDAQCRHALDAAGARLLLTDDAARAAALGAERVATVAAGTLSLFGRGKVAAALPPGTAKITFTSGTTGQPKGVCLSTEQLSAVSRSVADIACELGIRRHLCMLPQAVLLENVAGADAAWLAGAQCVVPPLAEVGLSGSSRFDPRAALAAIERWQPDSLILLPQMLTALVAAVDAGLPAPRGLKLVAVGGARVSPDLITRARALGIPACEGYGLSEAGSVVALNLPSDPPGAVGRVLPHLRVELSARGEILVDGPRLPGYLGAPALPDGPLATGDIGHLDAAGRLHVTGRLKHQIITSFGRNVSPEWPEAELLASPAVAQVVVFGEARPTLAAVVVPRGDLPDAVLDAAVAAANARLPDYARIGVYLRADSPFSPANGLATDNGRVRRDAVWARYGERIADLYECGDARGENRHVLS
ncbi:MAG: AMP-binding protein [Methyloversatilis sp.]|jgi:long-subunit acyl-CoA synthetase (AMP-forming)|nr:AMP-binding protein [Methyloversatilis sp.]